MSTEDMKIYGEEARREDPVVTEAERAAQEYRLQQQNGNLAKAHGLGSAVTGAFLEMQIGREFVAQKWVLLSYLADSLLEQEIENPLLQKSAQAKFTSELEKCSPELSQIIHDAKAFTLYALNENRLRSRSEGEIFAALCERPGDQALAEEGEALAGAFAEKVLALIRAVSFVKS